MGLAPDIHVGGQASKDRHNIRTLVIGAFETSLSDLMVDGSILSSSLLWASSNGLTYGYGRTSNPHEVIPTYHPYRARMDDRNGL